VDQNAVASTVQFDLSDPGNIIKQLEANVAAAAWNAVRDLYLKAASVSALGMDAATVAGGEAAAEGILASNGTRILGLTRHGVQRVIGDGAKRAGTRPEAILDALRNPRKIIDAVDLKGRPFQIFTGENARVVVNPETGMIISTNPLSAAGAL
jgi:hypothetical protein